MYRTHQLLLAIASTGTLLLSAPAGAGQASTSFQVTATVGTACTLSASNLAFGSYTGTALSGQSDISINCSDGSLPTGSLAFASSTNFAMTNFSNPDPNAGGLDYDLYLDAAHTEPILSGQSVSVETGAAGVIIFGEIPAGQTVEDGSYSDTVSVVFNF